MTEQERERVLEYMTEVEGISRDEVEGILEDQDIWMLRPQARHWIRGEEAVRHWRSVVKVTDALAEVAFEISDNPAVIDLIRDADDRAKESLRRVRERLGEGG